MLINKKELKAKDERFKNTFTFKIDNEDQLINLKESISIDTQMSIIAEILDSIDQMKVIFFHPVHFRTTLIKALIDNCTDLKFKEDTTADKIVDYADAIGLSAVLMDAYGNLCQDAYVAVNELVRYNNSARGIVDAFINRETNEKMLNDFQEAIKEINENGSLDLVKDVMAKLG